jgi:hypothetical protein
VVSIGLIADQELNAKNKSQYNSMHQAVCHLAVSAISVKSDPTNGNDRFSLIKCVYLIMRFLFLNLASS